VLIEGLVLSDGTIVLVEGLVLVTDDGITLSEGFVLSDAGKLLIEGMELTSETILIDGFILTLANHLKKDYCW
jgi:Na+/H+ antiporter NhaC